MDLKAETTDVAVLAEPASDTLPAPDPAGAAPALQKAAKGFSLFNPADWFHGDTSTTTQTPIVVPGQPESTVLGKIAGLVGLSKKP